MILCKWCGDKDVSKIGPLFAEKDRTGIVSVYQFYVCNVCKLEFKHEVYDEEDK